MGSAALRELARRGLRVLGLERFHIGHDRGSSHGETRIIRKAYFEHPDYVPLLRRAYELWQELEQEAGEKLFHRTGLLEIGRPDGVVIPGVRRSAREHGLPVEDVPIEGVAHRFPGFSASGDMVALFEADAGYLPVERCVHVLVESARAHGATVREGVCVQGWTARGTDIVVQATSESLTAARLVLCPGPWAGDLLAHFRLPLSVRRKPVFWFAARPGAYDPHRGSPVFCFDTPFGFFYGFPAVDGVSVKVAEHTGGRIIGDADSVDRTIRKEDEQPVRDFVARHLSSATTEILRNSVCLYTMTPDEHFIIDRDPDHSAIAFAAGFSGHGFKFCPVVGSILADLVLRSTSDEPCGFLGASRPSLRGKATGPVGSVGR